METSSSSAPSGREIPGLGYPNDVYVMRLGAQAERLWLTPEETRLFGLVGHGIRLVELVEQSEFDELRTYELARALKRKGAIVPQREVQAPVSVIDALNEPDVELDKERKKEILALEKLLDTQNYYELFGLTPDASLEDIKRACFEKTTWYHPDKYYGRKLGSFKLRIEKIFKRLRAGQAVLMDEGRRASYNTEHGLGGSHSAKASDAVEVHEPTSLDARDAERRARLARHPYVRHQIFKKLQETQNARREAARTGATSSSSGTWPSLQSEAQRAEQASALEEDSRRASEAEAIGALGEAARLWQSASNRDPMQLRLALKAGFMGLAAGQEPRSVRFWAQRAVALQEDSPEAHLLMAKVLWALGSKVLADKSFGRVLQLDPSNEEARQFLRKKKSFWGSS